MEEYVLNGINFVIYYDVIVKKYDVIAYPFQVNRMVRACRLGV